LRLPAFALASLLMCAVDAYAQTAALPPPELPAVVNAVEVNGLWRTRPFVVPRELPWKPGEVVTPEAWVLGVQRVWNLGIFSRVTSHLEQRGDQRVAVFDLEERWTVNLLFRPSTGGGISQLQVGLYDISTLGRYIETGGFYQRLGQFNGGQLWINQPRLFDRRLQGMLTVDDTARPRLTYANARAHVQLDLIHEQRDDLHFGGRVEFMADHSLALPGASSDQLLPPDSKTLSVGAVLKLGIIDTIRIRQTGASLELRPSINLTTAPGQPVFGRFWAEALWFRMAGERWNFAVRGQVGAMTAGLDPQHFFLGGLDLIRGFEDNAVNTRLYALANVEVRFIAFDSTWVAFQPAVFLDGEVDREEAPHSARGLASTGIGIRMLCPRLVHSGLRIDMAVPLTPVTRPRLSAGVFQFF
jgi:hypothetical protein